MKKILSIAGSDCSGGAGIQADLKTITCHGMYGMSAITALTAQNTTGVYGIQETAPEFLASQLDCIFEDIFPDAVKIGMVFSSDIIRVIVDKLKEFRPAFVVVDPVMAATSGSQLMKVAAYEMFIQELFPLATMITPNIPEAERLSGCRIRSIEDMRTAAVRIREYYDGSILIKGGHLKGQADDLLYDGRQYHLFPGVHIATENTHGSGCTLSSAIACNLAAGYDQQTSVGKAKEYITGAMAAQLNLGQGNGPLLHNYQFIS